MEQFNLIVCLLVLNLLAVSFQILMKAMIYRRLSTLIHSVHDAVRLISGYGVASAGQAAVTKTAVGMLTGAVEKLATQTGTDSQQLKLKDLNPQELTP